MAKATSDSVMALSIVSVVLMSLCISVQAKDNFALWVNRRNTNDLYRANSTADTWICYDNYMIHERRCVSDEELLHGCGTIVAPIFSTFLIPTTGIGSRYSAIITIDDNFRVYVATFGFNRTNQIVNSSFCQISSLEVYRGRVQAIEISHQGFSLGDNGSIKIHNDQLAYAIKDYMGELYRMNLSCSGGELPESGCLFFKVAGNTSTAEAKFNCTVPGTLYDFIEECNITTMDKTPETISTITAMVTTTVTSTSNMPTNIPPTHTSFGITLLTSVIGDVVIAVILAVSIMIMCVIIRSKVGRNGQQEINTLSSTVKTASANTRPQEKTPVSANIQDQEGSSEEVPSQNPTYINLNPDHCHPMKNPAYVHVSFESS